MTALTLETFTPHVASTFRAATEAGDLDLVLDEAVGSAPEHTADGYRPPFSLVFRGPAQPVLPQRIYRLDHAALGPLDIFLVPVGADAKGVSYQAVFA